MVNLPEMPDRPAIATRRLVSEGAEQWLYVPIQVHEEGYVVLVDYQGSDLAIEEAARISYGKGTRKKSETVGLIRYLLRHDHTTPFEMVMLKFRLKMPIVVMRQWVRHRTASINEYSGRYSEMPDERYLPSVDYLAVQSTSNRQGRGEQAEQALQEKALRYFAEDGELVFQHYQELVNEGLSREIARINLPLSSYTELYWNINLHNLMHFLKLRLDPHAQQEIRDFAEAVAGVVRDAFPISWQAFEDYQLEAVKLTRLEQELLQRVGNPTSLAALGQAIADSRLVNNPRERFETLEKLIGGLQWQVTASVDDLATYLEALGLKDDKKREAEVTVLRRLGVI